MAIAAIAAVTLLGVICGTAVALPAGITTVTTPEGPCDIFEAAKTPCVAAHAVTRALYGGYTGPLYQVKRSSDGSTLDVNPVQGIANSTAQDSFCDGADCTIQRIYGVLALLFASCSNLLTPLLSDYRPAAVTTCELTCEML